MRRTFCSLVIAMMITSGASAQDNDAKPGNEASTRDQIAALIGDGKLEEASKAIDGGEVGDKDKSLLRRQLLSAFARQRDYASAFKIATADFNDNLENNLAATSVSLNMLAMYGQQAGKAEETLQIVDQAIEKFASAAGTEFSPETNFEFSAAAIKSRLLMSTGKKSEAEQLNATYLERAKNMLASSPESQEVISLVVSSLTTSMQTAADDAGRNSLFAEARDLLLAQLDAEEVDLSMVSRYGALMYTQISSTYRSEPDAAEEMMTELRTNLKAAAEKNEAAERIAKQYDTNLKRIESGLASARKLAKLVGSPAPPLDAKYWVNGKDMSVDSLDGKVVLLDFWAVWCGPCIATFPHLREWNEEFGPKGLQIVGVTRKYNYAWNEETKRASRAEGEVSDEEEMAMLEKFLAHHELQHPTIITPETSEMQSNFAVSGIPHAVLIDKKGNVRMIKVGSGEANATALHDMIVELLAE
jgi:thiol-disulfide isomerase/thioredoxin